MITADQVLGTHQRVAGHDPDHIHDHHTDQADKETDHKKLHRGLDDIASGRNVQLGFCQPFQLLRRGFHVIGHGRQLFVEGALHTGQFQIHRCTGSCGKRRDGVLSDHRINGCFILVNDFLERNILRIFGDRITALHTLEGLDQPRCHQLAKYFQ